MCSSAIYGVFALFNLTQSLLECLQLCGATSQAEGFSSYENGTDKFDTGVFWLKDVIILSYLFVHMYKYPIQLETPPL
jgi:hypothetical protein